MGTFIEWPKDLIAVGNNSLNQVFSAPKRANKGLAKKIRKSCNLIDEEVVEPELVVDMGRNYPSPLNHLWTWVKGSLSNGRTIFFQLGKEAFGMTKKEIMFLSDIHAVCSGGEMAGSVICLYIHFLNDYVKKNKMSSMISFVHPSTIGATGCGNATQRSHALAAHFKGASKGEYFPMPYNDMNHWTLTVVNPDAEIVYYIDPLKRRIANGEWVDIIDNAIKLYTEDLNKVVKKKLLWESMEGVPVQTGNKDCGLFVIRYMKEIIHDKELDFVT
ncbi:uncharacterized protein LOC141695800 [Apium graveolens]|uniref:uncharacterized protein LOC141695800 n=1 Tax=Apium graveolens TaxID=4045 RepID=UPI003D7BE91C